jgi:hypothetical protein
MNPGDLNSAARLILIAKNCGAEFLDDPNCFDRMFGRGSFAKTDREPRSPRRQIRQ